MALRLSLIFGLYLLNGCSETPDVPDLDIASYYASADTSGYIATLESNHHSVRDDLEARLRDYPLDPISSDSIDTKRLTAELSWLVSEYTRWSMVCDLEFKLSAYQRWNNTERVRKLALDSTLAAIVRDYERAPGPSAASNVRPGYRHRLVELRAAYLSLGDSMNAAATDYYRGKAFYDEQEFDLALIYLERGHKLALEVDYLSQVAKCGLVESKIRSVYQGDYFAAQDVLRRAAESAERIDDKRLLASVLVQQGYCAQQLFQSSQARTLSIETLAEAHAVGMHRYDDYCYNLIAESFIDDNLLDSATHYAHDAVEVAQRMADEKKSSGNLTKLGYTKSTLGVIAMVRCDFDEASKWFDEAELMLEAASDTLGLCVNRGRRAALLASLGHYTEAMELCRFVLGHSDKFESQIHAIFGLALGSFQLGDIARCRENLRIGIQRLEDSREKMLLADLREGMLSDKTGFYTLMALTYIKDAEPNNDRRLYDSAFIWLERGQARTLKEQLDQKPGNAIGLQESELIDSISNLENRIIMQAGFSSELRQQMTGLSQRLLDLRLANAAETGRSETPTPIDITPGLVQDDILRSGQVLLAYLLTPLQAYLFALSSDSVLIVPLRITTDSLNDLARSYQNSLSEYPQEATLSSGAIQLGHRLADILIPYEFLRDVNCQRLIIVGSGHLQQLPFEALINDDGSYLVEKYQVTYAPSAACLRQICAVDSLREKRSGIIVFADPVLPPNSGFDRLTSSAAEAKQITSLFGNDAFAYVGADATETNFRALDSTETRYLHLATHAVCDPRDPSRSAILFSSATDMSGVGLLHTDEIEQMFLPLDLVFLSACRSGGGKVVPGEGVLSLARPFLIAGTRAVIATLWNIDDAGTAEFVGEFYRNLRNNSSVSEALAQSKRQMIKSSIPLYRHPFFWSPFVAIGDP